jgi:processive 1,2-diacylglycerol beta-glucosyltransferase
VSDTQKVILVSAKAGTGHIRAAEAIEEAFHLHHPAVNVRHIEILEYTNALFRNSYTGGYNRLIANFTSLWRLIYEKTDAMSPTGIAKRLTEFMNRLNCHPFMSFMRREDPDATVVTHFLAAEIVARMRRRGELRGALHVMVTDFDIHSMWVHDGVDHYHVASDEIAAVLRMKGVPEDRIRVTGIPIVAAFSKEYLDRRTMRRNLSLREEPMTVLVSAGGFGLSRVDLTVAMLAEAVPDVQIVAIAGRNEKLKRDLEKVAASHPGRVVPTGFVTNMHELMVASDFAVAKSGGLTVSECMATGLPMIIFNPIPGQEERNSDYMLENGAALRANSPAQLLYKFKLLMSNPDRLDRMREATRRLAHPHAAKEVSDLVVGAKSQDG